MLISPPFLPTNITSTSDADFVRQAMPPSSSNIANTTAPEGSFPVSFNLGWHGGTHLCASAPEGDPWSVRAMADGEVVFFRAPTPRNQNKDDPLNYNPHGDGECWTDNGMLILKHNTDIGSGANAQNIEFFSVYVHMSEITAELQQIGKKVYRKDVLGQTGFIYARRNHIHFEIVCDDANLQKLVGRSTGKLPLTENGRTDAVYGAIYFYLPAGTPFYRESLGETIPGSSAGYYPGFTSTEPQIVALNYTAGNATWISYQMDGTPIGEPLTQAEAEYNLYTRANEISSSHVRGPRPAPSAVYELLRFGRIINTEHETLNPATCPNWQQVRYPGGTGWVDLNVATIKKFSDADFPDWMGWLIVDDDTEDDSRCESTLVRSLIASDEEKQMSHELTREVLEQRLSLPTVRNKLAKTICKFPSEWNADTIDARWGWIRTDPIFELNDENWALFKKHVSAFTVPAAQLPEALGGAHWHFHPQSFIEHFRKCGWLSHNELALCLPHFPAYTQTGTIRHAVTTGRANQTGAISLRGARDRIQSYVNALNLATLKYGISTVKRKAHFFAQVTLETDKWATVQEYGRGATNANMPMTQYYAAFYGRGIMQLTWAGNYLSYGNFRQFPNHAGAYADNRITATSTHYFGDPTMRDAHGHVVLDPRKHPSQWSPHFDPSIIHSDAYNACDSGGFYWVSKHHSGHIDINRVADREFTPESIGRVSVLVNGGGNGYFERQAYAQYIYRYLSDSTKIEMVERFETGRTHVQIDVNFNKPT